MAAQYLDVFNRGDRKIYEKFLASHWPGADLAHDEFLGNEDRSRVQSGGYDLVDMERRSPLDVVDVVKARLADDYFRLELRLRPTDGAIDRLTLVPINRPADIPPPRRVKLPELRRLIDRRLAAMGDFSGAILVAVAGRPVYVRASGYSDREGLIANAPETPFRMASMSKMFTAVAVMQLVEAGRLDLDTSIARYLPDYPNAAFADTVTVRQLLTHTAGAGDFHSKQWADNFEILRKPADYVTMFGARAPQFTPGSRFRYANYGYVVLGRLIEVASGKTYLDYLRDQIFTPAGMAHSGLDPLTAARPVAKTYVAADGRFQRPPPPFNGPATPAGSAYSTVGDMLKFAEALTSFRLLTEQSVRQLWTRQVHGDADLKADYGFGFEVRDEGGVLDVGHDGGGPGQNGAFRILGRGQAVVVVLSNVAPTWRGDKLGGFIATRLSVH